MASGYHIGYGKFRTFHYYRKFYGGDIRIKVIAWLSWYVASLYCVYSLKQDPWILLVLQLNIPFPLWILTWLSDLLWSMEQEKMWHKQRISCPCFSAVIRTWPHSPTVLERHMEETHVVLSEAISQPVAEPQTDRGGIHELSEERGIRKHHPFSCDQLERMEQNLFIADIS